jgi:ELWxxDGT repeat protein
MKLDFRQTTIFLRCALIHLGFAVLSVVPSSAAEPWKIEGPSGWLGLGSDPIAAVAVGDRLFFTPNSAPAGTELWITDGTEEGTRMVRDIRPGAEPGAIITRGHAILGEQILFIGDDGTHSSEIWISDGTAAGTKMVIDLTPGSGGTETQIFGTAGGFALFPHTTPEQGRELWRTDGTEAGTTLVKDLNPNPFQGSDPVVVAQFGHRLLFSAFDGISDRLSITDGSTEGTTAIGYFRAIGGAALKGEAIFAATAGDKIRVFSTGGSEETTTDLEVTLRYLDPASFKRSGDIVYFVGSITDRQEDGNALWRTDGTVGGTWVVHRFDFYASDSHMWTAGMESDLFFSDGSLFRTDGSREPAARLTDAATPVRGIGFDGSRLFYKAPMNGVEALWVVDATGAAARVVTTLGNWSSLERMFGWNGKLFFAGFSPEHGFEPWVSDGTSVGTKMLKNIQADHPRTTLWGTPVALGQRLVITAGFDVHQPQSLYLAEPPYTTFSLLHHNPPYVGSVQSKGLLFYPVWGERTTLWRTDGTIEGTFELATVAPHGLLLEPTANGVIFLGEDAEHGVEPWVSDGTLEGTGLLVDTVPGLGEFGVDISFTASSYQPEGLVFFWTRDPQAVLWVTDGTRANTHSTRVSPMGVSYFGAPIYPVGDFLLGIPRFGTAFVIRNGTTEAVREWRPTGEAGVHVVNGRVMIWDSDGGVWSTDGSLGGTFRVPTEGHYCLAPVTAKRNDLVFWMGVAVDGRAQLWRSDGTVEGTGTVADFSRDERGSCGGALVQYGKGIAFSATDLAGRGGIWISDGTVAGTRLDVPLTATAPYDNDILQVAVIGNLLFGTRPGAFDARHMWAIPLGPAPGDRRRPVRRGGSSVLDWVEELETTFRTTAPSR